jgi:hypothetical protein
MIDRKIDIGDKLYDFTAPAIIVSKDANGNEVVTNITANGNVSNNTNITASTEMVAGK